MNRKRRLFKLGSISFIFFFVFISYAQALDTISGKITAGKEKAIVTGAVVKVVNVKTQQFYSSQKSDAQGNFQISGLPEGLYVVGVSTTAGDYLFENVVELAQLTETEQPLEINVEERKKAAEKTAGAKAREALISVRIFWLEDDEPVEGAKVYLKNMATSKTYRGSKTDSKGCSFVTKRLDKVPAGEYEILVKFQGELYMFGDVIQALGEEGTFLTNICLGIPTEETTMSRLDRDDCECDLTSYVVLPWWKTPLGIASIAGVVGGAGFVIFEPTPLPSSPTEP
ncbi:carboxypeptidase regulatory-like domain-containing protein [candidate division CSSED10-310 bacterium]|uniref:Carboxypeptidase regulatory-like domain-containing protein n=1 Tax=candidate division CSSED10-310 bacterium TaxID=2855610 RepID=A0ABV6Z4U6_UNCC1